MLHSIIVSLRRWEKPVCDASLCNRTRLNLLSAGWILAVFLQKSNSAEFLYHFAVKLLFLQQLCHYFRINRSISEILTELWMEVVYGYVETAAGFDFLLIFYSYSCIITNRLHADTRPIADYLCLTASSHWAKVILKTADCEWLHIGLSFPEQQFQRQDRKFIAHGCSNLGRAVVVCL